MEEVKCPFCGGKYVQLVDHLPLSFTTIPFEDILYGSFQCLNVACTMQFEYDLKITTFEIPKIINLN